MRRASFPLSSGLSKRNYAVSSGRPNFRNPHMKDTFAKPPNKAMFVLPDFLGSGIDPVLDPFEKTKPNVPSVEPLSNTVRVGSDMVQPSGEDISLPLSFHVLEFLSKAGKNKKNANTQPDLSVASLVKLNDSTTGDAVYRLLCHLDIHHSQQLLSHFLTFVHEESELIIDFDPMLKAQWDATANKGVEFSCYSETALYSLALMQAMVSCVVISSTDIATTLYYLSSSELKSHMEKFSGPSTKTSSLTEMRETLLTSVEHHKYLQIEIQQQHAKKLEDFLACAESLEKSVLEEHPEWSGGVLVLRQEIERVLTHALKWKSSNWTEDQLDQALLDEKNDGYFNEIRRAKIYSVSEDQQLSPSASKLRGLKGAEAVTFGTMYDVRLLLACTMRNIFFRCSLIPNRAEAALNAMYRRRVGPVGVQYHQHNLPVEVGHASYHDMTTFRRYDHAGWYARYQDVLHRNVSLRIRMKDLRAPSHYNNAPLLDLQGERRLRILAGERVTGNIVKLDSDRYEQFNDNWEYGEVKLCQLITESKKADLGKEYWPTVEVKVRKPSGKTCLSDSLADWERIEKQAEKSFQDYKARKATGVVYVSPMMTWLSVKGLTKTTTSSSRYDAHGYASSSSRDSYVKN
eukprot:PhF_6_TR21187/c0_g1_i1/m.30552